MATRHLEHVSREVVERVAKVMGRSSAAAQAIEDFEGRTAAGEQVAFYKGEGAWFVGPLLPTA